MKKPKQVEVDTEIAAKIAALEAENGSMSHNMATNALINQLFEKEAYTDTRKYVSTAGLSSCTPDSTSGLSSSSSIPYEPLYKPFNIFKVDDIIVGGMSVHGLIQLLESHIAKEKSNATNTNLERVRSFSAEKLAEFIVHTSRHMVSGSGDAVVELTAWLNSNVE